MSKNLKRPWWAYAVLFCLCGLSIAAKAIDEGGTILPPNSLYGGWYLLILPILAAAVVFAASRKRGKFDVVSLLVFEVLLLFWFFVPSAIQSGGFYAPAEMPIGIALLIISLPAFAALILSGIAYAVIKK